jgi:hypothetical protein
LGSWALSKVNVRELHFQNPNADPQEAFYQTCRHFMGWEKLTLAQLLRYYSFLETNLKTISFVCWFICWCWFGNLNQNADNITLPT